MKRRTFIHALAATLAGKLIKPAAALASVSGDRPNVVVVGAGAFGGWTALYLLRKGARVTLLDAWGAGHPLPSSGGLTRVIRMGYADGVYVEMARRALQLWQENGERWGQKLYTKTGVLWLSNGHPFVKDVVTQFDANRIPYERLDIDELGKRYPQINPEGLTEAVFEPEAGYVLAGDTSRAVVKAFTEEGGTFRQVRAEPVFGSGGKLSGLDLSDGGKLVADRYVFACGPWLKSMFPRVLGKHLTVSRQEVLYFKSANPEFQTGTLPIWADLRDKLWYGIPGNAVHDFKIADDTHGADFDPDSGDRLLTDQGIRNAREFLALRFPGLENAELLRSRVCQYTNTVDSHFIIDKHPDANNVWIVGGGSGHGLKHGPALGEAVAGWVLDERAADKTFGLGRFP